MERRQYLATVGSFGVAASAGLAGCGGLFETRSVNEPAVLEDRPDAVYVPTHVEGMQMAGMAEAGRLRLALTYSYPHRFWRMEGETPNRVDIESEQDVHLMISVWDAETGMVIPASNPTVSVTKDGDTVVDRQLWRMLSQNMGVHFGDNVTLDGDGTYEVTIRYGPVDTRATGVFQGAFDEQVERTIEMEFNQSTLRETSFERLEDREGERDAVDPMQMDMVPVPTVRPAGDMPGHLRAQGTSGDATFVVTVLEERPEGVDGEGPYLVVSPRTPYNRFPIPYLSLESTMESGGETVLDAATLTPTLSPTLDFHYGASIDAAAAGDSLTVTPLLPPQISRHEGYETAFLDMAPMDLTLESV